jgi:sortase A
MLLRYLIQKTRIFHPALFSLSVILLLTQPASADNPATVAPTPTLDSPVVPVGLKQVKVNGQTYPQWQTDDQQVGWHNLTATLGRSGNTVLNGHSDVYAKVFQNLDKLKIGDEIVVFSNEHAYRYVVTERILVREKGISVAQRLENAKLILPTEDERLTLITCSQPGATHRLIIIAKPA